jgi:mannose-6-phosphate isomerase-like protein (cupin superfamily)
MKTYHLDNLGVIGGRESESNIYIKNLLLGVDHNDAELHSHPDSDEYYVVLDGRILFEHKEGTIEIGTGGIICFARGELHRISRVITPSKVMIIKSTNSVRDIQ